MRVPQISKWVTVISDDVAITIDGCNSNNSLRIIVDANGVRYMLTDVLLEIMLGMVAEEFSNEYLNFNVYPYGDD